MRTLALCFALLALLEASVAFTTVPRPTTKTTSKSLPSSLPPLSAKKRRRRKDLDSPSSDSELPDFDIDEEEEPVKKKNTSKSNSPVVGTSPEGETITAAMMGSPQMQAKSVRDLIQDRSLEQKLSFDDDEVSEDLPDLMQLSTPSFDNDGQPLSKKKARQAARQAAAAARQEEEESSLNAILANIPFLLDEKGQVSALKLLEAGTWLGIGLLVSWEVYINSPFFERAAPMAPVVY